MKILHLFVILVLALASYGTGFEIAENNKPAIVKIYQKTNGEVIPLDSIIDNMDLVVGKRYYANAIIESEGAIVSSDGYIIASSADNESLTKAIIENASGSIVNDIGNFLHVKYYGIKTNDEELDNYNDLVRKENGNAGEKFYEGYRNGKISAELENYSVEVVYFENHTAEGKIIYEKDGIVLLKIDESNLPIISLENLSIEDKDMINIINPRTGETNQEIVEFGDNSEIRQTKDASEHNVYIVSNENEESTGIILGTKLVDGKKLSEISEEFGILRTKPDFQTDYEDAIKFYQAGDEQKALEKFKESLAKQPENSYAHRYVDELGTRLDSFGLNQLVESLIKKIAAVVEGILPREIFSIVPFAAGIIVLVMLIRIGSMISSAAIGKKKIKP